MTLIYMEYQNLKQFWSYSAYKKSDANPQTCTLVVIPLITLMQIRTLTDVCQLVLMTKIQLEYSGKSKKSHSIVANRDPNTKNKIGC